MSYLGICDKYGQKKVMLSAYALPIVVDIVIKNLRDMPMDHIIVSANSVAILGGGVGFVLGIAAHVAAYEVLQKRKIGLTRGSEIVRKVQAAAYAIPVAAVLTFNAMSMPEVQEVEQANDNSQATTQMVVVNHHQDIPTLQAK